jgi:glycosyltransferase involved in cell wall biosynthesis
MRAALGERVRFTGALPRNQVQEELLRADVLLSASSSEAFGLSIAEALACGCNIIAADAGPAVRELLGGEVVPVGDIEAFVRALEALKPGLNLAGRERIRARYSAGAMGDAYAALLHELPSRPDKSWRPPMYRTPDEALPRTLRARMANWLRAFS